MTVRTVVRTAVILTLVACSASTGLRAEDAEARLVLNLTMVKSVLYAGEPAFVRVRVTNRDPEPKKLDLGWNAAEGISFLLKDTKGERVAEGAIRRQYGLARSGTISVPGRGTFEREYLLNKWISTVLPIGQYTLICTVTDVRSSSVKLSSASRLRIIPTNKERLEKLFEQYTEKAATEVDGGSSMMLLSYSRSPLVVPYLVSFLGDDVPFPAANMKTLAVEGLGRVGTVEAVEELVRLIRMKDPKSLDSEGIVAVSAVFEINDTATDPEVKRACREIVETMPRPLPILRSP